MNLRYDDDFLEAAVFAVARGRPARVPALQIHRFHAAREKCYHLPDPDERNAAFFRLHLDWFREWGLERRLLEVVAEYPLLAPALHALALRGARSAKDEAADLYVNDELIRTGVIALRPERFADDPNALTGWLRHELMHVSDMVDPRFGYSPDLPVSPRINPAQGRIIRERYRLLWDITIDGRLARTGRGPEERRERHAAVFDRAFAFWPPGQRREVFARHWTEPGPSHHDLMALAADPRDLRHSIEPVPGGACPLCHFATFAWAETSRIDPGTLKRIAAQFPAWTSDQGVCQRCIETYELAGRFELPPTVVL